MFIGDGAKMIRDAFALAKEKCNLLILWFSFNILKNLQIFLNFFMIFNNLEPSIIFIDELDAIGTKRFDSDGSGGDREV